MPTYFSFSGVKIQMFFGDHNPPHFHAVYAEYIVVIDIKKCEVIQGELPKKKLKLVLQWAKENQLELLNLWKSIQEK